LLPLNLSCEVQRGLDIPALGAFVATCQQDNQHCTALNKIHPVAWAIIDPKLRHPVPDRRDIAWVAQRQPLDTHQDTSPSVPITQRAQPAGECVGLLDFDHGALSSTGDKMSRLFVGSVVAAVRPVWSRFDARSGNGAPDVVVGGEAFRVRLEALQEELEVLNIEAPVLQARIAQNVAELLAV
jgi:hypothetical protein